MKELDKISKEFGDNIVKQLTEELIKAGKDKGALIKSLKVELQPTAKSIKIIIDSEDYLEYVDKGRKPGKYPNFTSLKKWIKLKGIPKKALFPIAKSIYKHGIKPTNVIDKTFKKFDKILDDYIEEIAEVFINDINKNINKK